MTIKQRSIGFGEGRHLAFFDEEKMEVDKYIRSLVDQDLKKKNKIKFLPSVEAKESDFVDFNQKYPYYNHIVLYAEEGYLRGNALKPDFKKLVFGLPDDFQKEFIEVGEMCWESHLPFAYQDCVSDQKSGKFESFEDYYSLKNFRWIDEVLRFKYKTAYDFEKSPEAKAREKAEFEEGENLRQAERNSLYAEQLEIKRLAKEIREQESEQKARKVIEKQKQDFLKLQEQLNHSVKEDSNEDGN